jgi:actin-like ATPase involved in cell morphogenesis
MTYALGIDLGTTYTAAAVARDGRAEVAALGYRATSVPTVVLLTEDGRFLVGDAAERRAGNEPNRVAREFKRRVGDATPLLLGGTPVAVDRCLAEVLTWVTATVGESEGGPPASITVTHPANWGEFKKDVLREALRLADLSGARLLPEPVAAATWYAKTERLPAGHVVAVYDLGGGTFDAAVLRQKADGEFENLGRAEGIERLGGVDIDQAVLGHVLRSLGDDAAHLVEGASDDLGTMTAIAQLRRACVEAKEVLSSETSVEIPVFLPGLHHEVLMQRAELEELVEPLLRPTVDALGRVVRSTGLTTSDVHSVLLVGGSSRIPMIARQVSEGFGRPIAVDAHPKHPVALGAALDAAAHMPASAPSAPASVTPAPTAPVTAPSTAPTAPMASPVAPVAWAPSPPLTPAAAPRPFLTPPPPIRPQSDNRGWLVGAGVAAVVLLLTVLAYMLSSGDDDPDVNTASNTSLGQTNDTDPSSDITFESGDTPGTTAAPRASVDLLRGDASPALNAFAQINDGAPVTVAEMTLWPDRATISIQTPENPEFFDDYAWEEGGEVATRDGETLIPPDESEVAEGALFDLASIDPAVIPGVVQKGLENCPGEGVQLDYVIIQRWTAFDDQVMFYVYASNPDRSNVGGYVKFTLDGSLVENFCD